MQNNKQTKNQKGFTLFEILIGAVIFTILAAIIVPQLTAVKDRNVIVTQEVGLMGTTLGNIEDRFFDEVIIATNLTNAEVVTGKIIADSYRVGPGNTIFNLFGGNITIVGIASNGITWTTRGVTETACTKFVDDAKTLGFDNVVVDGGATLDYSTTGAVTNATIAVACTAAFLTDDTADLVFTKFGNAAT